MMPSMIPTQGTLECDHPCMAHLLERLLHVVVLASSSWTNNQKRDSGEDKHGHTSWTNNYQFFYHVFSWLCWLQKKVKKDKKDYKEKRFLVYVYIHVTNQELKKGIYIVRTLKPSFIFFLICRLSREIWNLRLAICRLANVWGLWQNKASAEFRSKVFL